MGAAGYENPPDAPYRSPADGVHVSFSPDARYIASASFDKKAKIWNETLENSLRHARATLGQFQCVGALTATFW